MAKRPAPPDRAELLRQELRAVQLELALAYDRFDQAAEPELVEACIYEIKAIHARFSYLYRAIHEQEGGAAAASAAEGAAVWM